jgi:hypothetical protein
LRKSCEKTAEKGWDKMAITISKQILFIPIQAAFWRRDRYDTNPLAD